MGYYTNYALSIIGESEISLEQYKEEIGEMSGYGGGTFTDEIKWYDHTKHMIEYSKEYPNVTFILECDGEDYDSYWKEYFRNGKTTIRYGEVTIVYKEFDEKDLE